MSTSIQNDFRRFFTRGGFPVTVTLMVAYGVATLLTYAGTGVGRYLAFSTLEFPVHFWTLFTWPVVGAGDPLSVLFALGWTYLFGGSIERAWGTRDYLLFLVATGVLTAVSVWAGSRLLGQPAGLAGLWVAMAPVVVAWSVVNRREVINFWFLPIPGPMWGAIGVLIAWFYAGGGAIGLFATAGCAAAYWYATQGRYGRERGNPSGARFGGTAVRRDDVGVRFRNFDPEATGRGGRAAGFNPLKWWRDRQERKRLEKIFRNSGFGDDAEDRRRR
jgi:membrane associated rhomboid family serine protease